MPADENILKKTEKKKYRRYQDVNKIEVKFCKQIPVDTENENNKHKMQILITERNDITSVLGMNWLKKLTQTIGRK